jgi:cell division protein FtsW (lipid II flippase)
MFSYPNLWVMLTGILLGLTIIISAVYFVNKMFINDTKDVLVRFIILVFTALVALFIVDKVIAFRIKLLADEINKELFDLIKTLILMIFSYYFGTKNNSKENH